jgi:hypothetical protein
MWSAKCVRAMAAAERGLRHRAHLVVRLQDRVAAWRKAHPVETRQSRASDVTTTPPNPRSVAARHEVHERGVDSDVHP